MKKILFALCVFAFVFALIPCKSAFASTDDEALQNSIVQANEKAEELGYDLTEYKYYFAQRYIASGNTYTSVLYSKYPLSYCTKYTSNGLGNPTFHPSNSIDDGTSYIHQSETDTLYLSTNLSGQWEKDDSTFAIHITTKKSWTLLANYTNHDIYNFETGDLVFQAPPVPMTELAKILEESNRQRSPMFQVIYLLPLGISLVVSFLALRKCLSLLRTILSQG